MKKITALLLVAAFVASAIAQTNSTYWIVLKDKNNSSFSVSNPSQFLTERAIERRARQHIKTDVSDLPVNETYLNTIKSTGVTILNKSKWLNAISVSTSDASIIKTIQGFPFVKKVQLLCSPATHKLPDKFGNEHYENKVQEENPIDKSPITSHYNYGPSYFQAHQIGVDCLHNLGYHGEGIVIAYLDAGFYKVDSFPAFDSLRVNNQILGTRDFVNGGTMVYNDASTSHGMMTLSCSGGNLPGRLVGTAPKADFWLLRTENIYSETLQEETNWLYGAEFADSVGADVINSSLGYSLFDGGIGDHTYADMNGHTTIVSQAAEWAARKGIFVTSSAGNSGGPPWFKITAPADADSILTVGAVDSAGIIVSFSSRGPSFDGRVKPNTCARGYQSIVAWLGGDVIGENGTSFSSPITAGAVACLWQAHPTATNQQLIDAIQQSASLSMSPDSIQGYGIPNFCYAHSILHVMIGVEKYQDDVNLLYVYPNPFNTNFCVTFFSDKKQTVEVELMDVAGRRISKEEKTVFPEGNSFRLADEKELAPGIYILRLITPEKTYFRKIVKE